MTPDDIAKLISEDNIVEFAPMGGPLAGGLDLPDEPMPDESMADGPALEPPAPDSEEVAAPEDNGAEPITAADEDPETLRAEKEAAEARAKAAEMKAKASTQMASIAKQLEKGLDVDKQAHDAANASTDDNMDRVSKAAQAFDLINRVGQEVDEKGLGAINKHGTAVWYAAKSLGDLMTGTKYQAAKATGNTALAAGLERRGKPVSESRPKKQPDKGDPHAADLGPAAGPTEKVYRKLRGEFPGEGTIPKPPKNWPKKS